MDRSVLFSEVRETVDRLSDEAQQALVEFVRSRTAELGRKRVLTLANGARRELEKGWCKSASLSELIDEVLS